ncbi:hypothetical protein SCHPADRAFT_897268 [Schizopora paradoxa]|uniref:Uncharacterized protein n=1 Tax=Schizopora paradoxa TaxID=27342 RepID=A0A0H2QX30_9AGAM|nr:hypothetical protein SCHPADRAFT_897268 [Schizopora paradoxa]
MSMSYIAMQAVDSAESVFKVLDSEGHVYKMWMKEREDLEMVVARSIPYDSEKVVMYTIEHASSDSPILATMSTYIILGERTAGLFKLLDPVAQEAILPSNALRAQLASALLASNAKRDHICFARTVNKASIVQKDPNSFGFYCWRMPGFVYVLDIIPVKMLELTMEKKIRERIRDDEIEAVDAFVDREMPALLDKEDTAVLLKQHMS